jgi:hypothetical protein
MFGLAFVATCALLPHAQAEAQTPQVRMRWQDFVSGPDGAKRLASLQSAIQTTLTENALPFLASGVDQVRFDFPSASA